jgi:hypothetical protein
MVGLVDGAGLIDGAGLFVGLDKLVGAGVIVGLGDVEGVVLGVSTGLLLGAVGAKLVDGDAVRVGNVLGESDGANDGSTEAASDEGTKDAVGTGESSGAWEMDGARLGGAVRSKCCRAVGQGKISSESSILL